MEDCQSAINTIKRIQRKWLWLERHHPEIAAEADNACKPGRPKKPKEKTLLTTPDKKPIGQMMVAAYCEAFKSRYDINPPITGQASKLLKGLGEQIGCREGELLIRNYLKMNDQWFVKRNHDVPTLIASLNKIKVFTEKGISTTHKQAVIMEQMSNNASVVQELVGSGS